MDPHPRVFYKTFASGYPLAGRHLHFTVHTGSEKPHAKKWPLILHITKTLSLKKNKHWKNLKCSLFFFFFFF